MNISVIDVVFILLIALFMLRCFLKGFISEVLSMASVVLGLLASVFFYKNGAVFLKENFLPELSSPLPEIIAFAALFLMVFLVIKLLEILLKGIIIRIKLGPADKFLGLLFGIAEGIAVIGLVLFILSIQPLFDAGGILEDSFFAKLLLPLISEAGSLTNV
jgi:membrane protein required for colicin V production